MIKISQSALEEGILALLCYHERAPELIDKVNNINLFVGQTNKKIAKTSIDYISKYQSPPKQALEYLLEDDLRRGTEGQLIRQELDRLVKQVDQIDPEFIFEQLDRFIEHQILSNSLQEALELLGEGDLEKAKERLSKQDYKQREVREEITLQDPSEAFSFLESEEESDYISSGIEVLDRKGVRPDRKTITFLIAASGKGKCIAEDELVILPNGNRIPIRDAVEGNIKSVLAFSEEKKEFFEMPVTKHWRNGKKQCFRITTQTGREITTSADHPFLTETGWKPLKDLCCDFDKIALASSLPNLGKKRIPHEEVRLLAYLITEGCLVDQGCYTFTNEDPDIQKDFEICVNFMGDRIAFPKNTIPWEKGFCYIVNDNKNRWKHGSRIKKLLKDCNLNGKKSNVKNIPNLIFELEDDLIAEFLKIFFSCDGSIYAESTEPTIEISLASTTLTSDVNYLLMRLGIIARFSRFTSEWKGKLLPNYARCVITGKMNVIRFIKEVGFSIKSKINRAEKVIQKFDGKRITNVKRTTQVSYEQDERDIIYYNKNRKLVSYRRKKNQINYKQKGMVSYYIPQCFPRGCKKISEFAFFDSIKSIEPVGEKETFDLSVEGIHNFLVNAVVTHNSWFLVNLGIAGLQHHHKVLHVTTELSQELTMKRYLQCMFSLTSQETESIRIPYFRQDQGQTAIDFNEIVRDSIIGKQSEIKKKLAEMKSFPPLKIKEFPTSTLSVSSLNSYLDHLDKDKNFRPTVLIIDYADLMEIDAASLRIDTGRLYRELRGLAVKKNLALITATQGNRQAESAKVVTSTNVSEDWSKIGTADNVLTYSQTSEEYKRGLARIYVAKARNATDRFMALIAQNYRIGQFCISSVQMTLDLSNQIEDLSSGV